MKFACRLTHTAICVMCAPDLGVLLRLSGGRSSDGTLPPNAREPLQNSDVPCEGVGVRTVGAMPEPEPRLTPIPFDGSRRVHLRPGSLAIVRSGEGR